MCSQFPQTPFFTASIPDYTVSGEEGRELWAVLQPGIGVVTSNVTNSVAIPHRFYKSYIEKLIKMRKSMKI